MFRPLLGLAILVLMVPLAMAADANVNPILHHDSVEAYSTDYRSWTHQRPGWVTIEIQGDGDTDLDLFVYDESGDLRASDLRYEDYGRVRFYAKSGETYQIEVRNLGGLWNAYTIQFDLE